jgi:chemotaxis protein MotB
MAGEDRIRVVVRRRRGVRGHQFSSAWKVAYADFTTAMMALFIVLWLLTQADMRLRQQIAQYFRDPGVLPGGSVIHPDPSLQKNRQPRVVTRELLVVQGEGEQEFLESGKKTIEKTLARAAREDNEIALLKDQVIVQVTDAGLSIQLVDKGRDMLFDVSSAALKPPVVELLKHLAGALGRMPNRVQIGGHTDSLPFAPEADITNWELAFARANAARRVLESHGLWPGQIHRVVGYADTEPLVPENPFAAENRRISILAER